MNEQSLLLRIGVDPKILAGKPVVKGTRLSVEFLLNLMASGAGEREILDEYAGLTIEDLQACLLFASRTVGSASFMPLIAESA